MHHEQLLCRMLGYCGHLARMNLEERLRQYDITPVQGHALKYLVKQTKREEITHRDLERALGLKPSTVNGVVERMEEKGLIVRSVGRQDARCRTIQVTEKGLGFSLAIDEAVRETEELLRSPLSPEETEQLGDMLMRIAKVFEREVPST